MFHKISVSLAAEIVENPQKVLSLIIFFLPKLHETPDANLTATAPILRAVGITPVSTHACKETPARPLPNVHRETTKPRVPAPQTWSEIRSSTATSSRCRRSNAPTTRTARLTQRASTRSARIHAPKATRARTMLNAASRTTDHSATVHPDGEAILKRLVTNVSVLKQRPMNLN